MDETAGSGAAHNAQIVTSVTTNAPAPAPVVIEFSADEVRALAVWFEGLWPVWPANTHAAVDKVMSAADQHTTGG